MFDFLKKKIGGFIDGITKKEEQKGEAPPKPPEKKPEEKPEKVEVSKEKKPKEKKPEPKIVKAPPKPEKAPPKETPKPVPGKKPPETVPKPPPEEKTAKPVPEKAKPPEKKATPPEPAPKKAPEPEEKIAPPPKIEKPPERKVTPPPERPVEKKPEIAAPPPKPEKIEPPPEKVEPPVEAKPPETEIEAPPEPVEAPPEAPEPAQPKQEAPKPETAKPKERVKLGFMGKVKSIITREVEISEADVGDMLDNLELELLEADVDLGVAENIKEDLSARLIGSRIPKDRLHSFVSDSIKDTLLGLLTNENMFTIEDRLESVDKPLKIMFIGINGAGKTTTIAKVANLLQKKGKRVVFAAADTFRAAAIEQMAVHAQRLDVKMIKREYGSDPTSVAYDAVNYAKAHGIDAVLIDTAGRQDTNISLLNEMKKMDRVIEPDLKIYIGESIAGNAIIEQVSSFNREVGIDGVILTKLDCDPKGGTMLSLSKATGVPIIYVGMGQAYDDLESFDPESIVARILE